MRAIGLLLPLAFVGFGSAAQGAVLNPQFSGSDLSLQAGDMSTFTLGLDLSPEGPYSKAEFVGEKVTIFSGDGDKQTSKIKKGDPTQAFSASFLYEEGGDYIASYRVKARYRELGQQIVDLNDWTTICEVILDLGRERLKGQLGLQVTDAGGELPDTPVFPPVVPPVIPPVVPPPEPPLTTVVPGPVAGAGLPALLALGGFVWVRRRKAAVPAAA